MARWLKVLRSGGFLVCFFFLLILIAARLDQQADQVMDGPFYAVDGDTLAHGDLRLRLKGIDAPELSQSCKDASGTDWNCGQAARRELASLIASRELQCRGHDEDRYRRLLVDCHAGTLNINAELVRRGLAIAAGDYAREQSVARWESRGMWAGRFETPRDFRESRGSLDGSGSGFGAWLMGRVKEIIGVE